MNLLQRQLPHKWWSLNTRNAQFNHRIKVMKGWDSLMKSVGYSELGEAGALTFPVDQRAAPNRHMISLIAAELLIAKTKLKTNPPLQRSNMTQPIHGLPPKPNPRPTPRPRTTAIKTVAQPADSMGFPTAQFQHLALNDDNSDERFYSCRSEEKEEEEEEMVRSEQEIPSVSSYSSTGTQEDEEKTPVDGDEDEDEDDELLNKFKSFLNDHKKQGENTNVSASAPQMIISHSPKSPSTPSPQPPSPQPPSPQQPKYQSLQPANQKTPPVPKKRTKFLKAVVDSAPKPSFAPIPEADDSPSLSKKPLSPPKLPPASLSPASSRHRSGQPSIPAVNRMQNCKRVYSYFTCYRVLSKSTITRCL